MTVKEYILSDLASLNQVGCGVFSSVYEHPSNKDKVIKYRHDSLMEYDGWYDYAEAIMSGKLSLYNSPKIYELGVIDGEQNANYGEYYAVLHKLHPIYHDPSDCFINIPCHWHPYLEILCEGILTQRVSDLKGTNSIDDITDMLPDNVPDAIILLCADIVKAIKYARTLDIDLHLDIHEENIMVDSMGNLILTDPFSYSGD